MTHADARFAVPAAAGWAATAVLVGVPSAAGSAAVVTWAAAGIAVVMAFARPLLAPIALALAVCAGCATAVAVHEPPRHPAALAVAAEEGRSVDVVIEATRPVPAGSRYWAGVVRSVDGVPVAVPAAILGEETMSPLEPGARVGASTRVTRTEDGDSRAYLLAPVRPIEVLSDPPAALSWAGELRSAFRDRARELRGDGGALLPGLAIGDTTAVSVELEAAMQASSLTHLTAVSGSNCAVIVGLALVIGRAAGLGRPGRVILGLTLLGAFVVLVTPEPSVVRAAIMAAIVLVLLVRGQPVRGLPVLALAVVGILLADPWMARDYGFALSVLATAGLLVLAGPLARVLATVIPMPLALALSVPLAAQAACQPVLVLLDASIPVYGVIANLLAAPAAPIATIVGLVACAASTIAPPIAAAAAWLAWLPASWIAAVAQFFAALPAARLPWPEGAIGVALAASVTLALVVAVVGRGIPRRVAAGVLAAVLVAYPAVLTGARLASVADRPGDWQVAMCDVGQGDAVVLRSAGRVALVDTGPDPALIGSCLSELGIERLDLLVLTHFDHDHVGGSIALLGRVGLVIHGPVDDEGAARLLGQLADSGARLAEVGRGRTGVLGDWKWEALWPEGGEEPGNGASVATRFEPIECTAGCLDVLLLGDLGASEQSRIAAGHDLGGVDVVKVSHHGSADQDPALYVEATAGVGLIGVGADNGYGHPTESVLEILESAGTAALRTDRLGLVLLAPDEHGIRVWSEREDDDGGRG